MKGAIPPDPVLAKVAPVPVVGLVAGVTVTTTRGVVTVVVGVDEAGAEVVERPVTVGVGVLEVVVDPGVVAVPALLGPVGVGVGDPVAFAEGEVDGVTLGDPLPVGAGLEEVGRGLVGDGDVGLGEVGDGDVGEAEGDVGVGEGEVGVGEGVVGVGEGFGPPANTTLTAFAAGASTPARPKETLEVPPSSEVTRAV
jgi:hypothetical protein